MQPLSCAAGYPAGPLPCSQSPRSTPCALLPPMSRPNATTANCCSDCLFIYSAPTVPTAPTDPTRLISHVAANLYLHRAHSLTATLSERASEYPVSTCRVRNEYGVGRTRKQFYLVNYVSNDIRGGTTSAKLQCSVVQCSAVQCALCVGGAESVDLSDPIVSDLMPRYGDKHAKLMPLVISMPKVNRQVHVVVVLRDNWFFPSGQV